MGIRSMFRKPKSAWRTAQIPRQRFSCRFVNYFDALCALRYTSSISSVHQDDPERIGKNAICRGILEHRGYLLRRVPGQPASYGSHLKGERGMSGRERFEVLNIIPDFSEWQDVEPSVLGRDRVAAAMQADALTVDCAVFLARVQR